MANESDKAKIEAKAREAAFAAGINFDEARATLAALEPGSKRDTVSINLEAGAYTRAVDFETDVKWCKGLPTGEEPAAAEPTAAEGAQA